MKVSQSDLIIVNADVRTMDAAESRYEAVAVQGSRIVALGTTDDIKALAQADTVIIDGAGRTVVPGFTDAHAHWGLAAKSITHSVDARTPPNETIADVLARGRAAARRTPPGEWIILQGSTFHNDRLRDKRYPTPDELDSISTVHPVMYRSSLHELVVNKCALQVSGITKDSPVPPGATVERDPITGEPTGVLLEMFGELPLPEPTRADLADSIKRVAWEHYLAQGVTAVQEIYDSVEVLRTQFELIKSGEVPLRLRAYGWYPLAGSLDDLLSGPPAGTELLPNWFDVAGIKFFADGGTSSYTAAFHDDYPGRPGHRGSLLYEQDEFRNLIRTAHSAGAQILVHAAGDRAQDETLAAFEAAFGGQPQWQRMHRIEHGGNVHWSAERAAWCRRIGVTPMPNPGFPYNYGEFWLRCFGPERARHMVPLRSMLADGFAIAGNSDTTGGDLILLHPIHNMWVSMVRRTYAGRIVDPGERLTVDEALVMYTRNGAIADRSLQSRGTLELGKLADIVVLSDRVDAVAPEDFLELRVDHTIVDGRVVYTRES